MSSETLYRSHPAPRSAYSDEVVISQNANPIEPPPVLPPEPPRRREGLLVATAVILGAAAVLGGIIGVQRLGVSGLGDVGFGDSGEQIAAEDQTDSSSTTVPDIPPADSDQDNQDADEAPNPDGDQVENEEAAPQPLVESVPCPSQYDDVICDAADFVQQARGRPFKEFPNIELLEDAQFDEALLEDFEESREDFIEDERLMKSLGLLPTDLDLFETFRELLEIGVVGFYDPETGRLVVRGDEFNLYGQSVLVHELVHALDDQWFDLNRDDFDSDDAQYGYLAVVEGNASRIDRMWQESLSNGELADFFEQELGALAPEDLDRLGSLPRILLNLQASPYQDGDTYVSSLVAEGGEESIDEYLTNPPTSSEQVLHPDADPDTLTVIDVEPPPVDGPVTSQSTAGELIVRFWLGGAAGDGWGGDTYVTWNDGDRICSTVDIVADTEPDLAELGRAAEVWSQGAGDLRSFELIDSVDGSKLRVTGCY